MSSLVLYGPPFGVIEDLFVPKLQVFRELVVVLPQLPNFLFLSLEMLQDGLVSIATHLALDGEAHDDAVLILVGLDEFIYGSLIQLARHLHTGDLTCFGRFRRRLP